MEARPNNPFQRTPTPTVGRVEMAERLLPGSGSVVKKILQREAVRGVAMAMDMEPDVKVEGLLLTPEEQERKELLQESRACWDRAEALAQELPMRNEDERIPMYLEMVNAAAEMGR